MSTYRIWPSVGSTYLRNVSSSQHIDKRLSYLSSTMNALQKSTKLMGPSPQGVFYNVGRTLLNYKWSAKTLRILSNGAIFFAGRPLVGPLLAYSCFLTQWPLPLALIVWGLWSPLHFWRVKLRLTGGNPAGLLPPVYSFTCFTFTLSSCICQLFSKEHDWQWWWCSLPNTVTSTFHYDT